MIKIQAAFTDRSNETHVLAWLDEAEPEEFQENLEQLRDGEINVIYPSSYIEGNLQPCGLLLTRGASEGVLYSRGATLPYPGARAFIEQALDDVAREYASLADELSADRHVMAIDISRLSQRTGLMLSCSGTAMRMMIEALEAQPQFAEVRQSIKDGRLTARLEGRTPSPAREEYLERLRQAAAWIERAGRHCTDSGKISVEYEQVKAATGVELRDDPAAQVYVREQLAGLFSVDRVYSAEDCMQLVFDEALCPRINVTQPTLREELAVPYEQLILVHAHKPAETPAIRLGHHQLTEDGQMEWGDVLNAVVTAVRPGQGGTEMVLSQVAPDRLSQFSSLLAGTAPEEASALYLEPGEDQNQGVEEWGTATPGQGM